MSYLLIRTSCGSGTVIPINNSTPSGLWTTLCRCGNRKLNARLQSALIPCPMRPIEYGLFSKLSKYRSSRRTTTQYISIGCIQTPWVVQNFASTKRTRSKPGKSLRAPDQWERAFARRIARAHAHAAETVILLLWYLEGNGQ